MTKCIAMLLGIVAALAATSAAAEQSAFHGYRITAMPDGTLEISNGYGETLRSGSDDCKDTSGRDFKLNWPRIEDDDVVFTISCAPRSSAPFSKGYRITLEDNALVIVTNQGVRYTECGPGDVLYTGWVDMVRPGYVELHPRCMPATPTPDTSVSELPD